MCDNVALLLRKRTDQRIIFPSISVTPFHCFCLGMSSRRRISGPRCQMETQLAEIFRAAEEYIAPNAAQEPPTPYHFTLDVCSGSTPPFSH